jgi:hydroxyethylthiazole kinase-like uncharacterized protein yjeF
MQPILDASGMREADRATIEDLGVPSLLLMENAATGLVDAIRDALPEIRSALILCGPGNNGGDGLAAARHLINGGLAVSVLLFGEDDVLTPDARTNLELARAFGVEIVTAAADPSDQIDTLLRARPDVIVDALLGTGLDRPLTGRLAGVVERVRGRGIVVAVDVPTGLSGSENRILGSVLEADLTVTFGALKRCHALPPAAPLCGRVVVVDIGIPPSLLDAMARAFLVDEEDAHLLLPVRPVSGHKGTFGHLLVVAGSPGRSGAAAMAARAAVVGGSGLVTVACPDVIASTVDAAVPESMTHALTSADNGAVAGPGDLDGLLPSMSAVVVGPGLGLGDGSRALLEWLVDAWDGPLLLDADAITLLGGRPERLAERSGETVLTPHPGELARLLGSTVQAVVDDPLDAVLRAADRANAVVLGKGYRTLIGDPLGHAWVNPTGDSHLATGGSGDVLSGLLGALLAQELPADRAAQLGAWLHGRAGEIGADTWPAAVPSGSLPELIARAWLELAEATS